MLRKFDFEKVGRQDFDKRNNVAPIADQGGGSITPLSMATAILTLLSSFLSFFPL